MEQRKEITVPLWLHNSGYLSGSIGPFEVKADRVDEGATITIGGETYLLPEKTSKKGLQYFGLATRGMALSLFKANSENPKAPKYRLSISELPPRDKPAPSKSSWDNTPTSVQAPVKAFSETTFGEEDVPF